ncbi:MAG: pur operon repressor [Firmicutes bacterium]|nr:pur operon repressor [Bacillota bacterium]
MRRSERISAVTKWLVDRPRQIITLAELGQLLGAAKSTLSEDIAIIRETCERMGLGRVETIPGAAGGVRYVPQLSPAAMRDVVRRLVESLADPDRILPGGFLYMSDIVASPPLLARIGELFATRFSDRDPQAVVTVETRGIPIALMTARMLNVPLAIVRRSSRPSDGTVVTMNYISGSARRIETMSLSRRAIAPGTRVLIIDDFMKAGGTARGLVDLMGEFQAPVVGVGVLIETLEPRQKLVRDYVSLVVLESVEEEERRVRVRASRWFDEPNLDEPGPGERAPARPNAGR